MHGLGSSNFGRHRHLAVVATFVDPNRFHEYFFRKEDPIQFYRFIAVCDRNGVTRLRAAVLNENVWIWIVPTKNRFKANVAKKNISTYDPKSLPHPETV